MAESPNQPDEKQLPSWIKTAMWLLPLPAFLLGLTVPFIGPDEPRYAEVGREMWQSGDRITPTLGGFHWFEKPPLLYWLEACFYSIFGVNEFAARLGPALFGLATILCLWALARSVARTKELSTWTVLIGASTLGLIVFSHAASTDIVVTLPMTLAMGAYFVFDHRWHRQESGSRLWIPLVVMYVAAGIAMLAKGLIGIIFPPAIIFFYLLLSGGWPPLRLWLSALWGIPLSLAVAATWYVPMYQRYGTEFINEFIVRQHFERFSTNTFQHPQAWYFYLLVLPAMTLPWLPFFAVGSFNAWRRSLPYAWRYARPETPALDDIDRLLIFSFAWTLVPLVVFSVSTSKLPGYVLPSLPPAIIVAAVTVYRLAQKRREWGVAAAGLALVTLLTVSVLLITALPRRAAEQSAKPLIDAASQAGYSNRKVLLMHSYNYSAEFYAAGRLERDQDGKQVRYFGAEDIQRRLETDGVPLLVIVPRQYAGQILDYQALKSQLLAESGEDAIIVVSNKTN